MEQTKMLDKYEYFESNKEYYYSSHFKIIFDSNKNILLNSNIQLCNNTYLEYCKQNINSIDLTINYETHKNIIFIQHWFTTYGHFTDELFNLYNFYSLLNNKQYKVGMNYKPIFNINYKFDNYDTLSKILFNSNNFINTCQHNIIKINNLILIKHDLFSPMFHMFPKLSVDKILSSLKHEPNNFNKNVFITRGTALHMPRNLDNQIEIEQHLLSINYNVINPEVIDIETLIQQIKNAENIYITWGGALVNLCYVNPNANIYIFKSLSYMHEELFPVFKFLQTYKNLYVIECNDKNKIDIPFETTKVTYTQ
uniref:Glycosyltransferase 61 catalytic domain-containing protein n=1 Tax=viral metagenome TaxID=1070528 RepID=A0A6C0B9P5_9ZZZZ